MNSAPEPRWEKSALRALLVLGVLVRVFWFAYNPSLWNDEVSLANNLIKYDVAKLATSPLDDLQAAPPGYLAVEKVLGSLGGYSEQSLRVFALGCGIAALFLFAGVARQTLTGLGRVVAVALFSLGGPLIYHSSEVKQYETEVLATVVILWLALRWREELTGRRALLAGGAGVFCVGFANSAVFTVAGVFAVLGAEFILRKQYRQAANAGLALVLPLGVFFAYYLTVLRHNPNLAALRADWVGHMAPWPVSQSALTWYARTVFFSWDHPFGLSLDLDLPFLPQRAAVKYGVALSYPALLMFGAGAWLLLRRDRWQGALVLAPLAVTVAASLVHQYPLNERLILFLAPVVYLAIGRAAALAGGELAGAGVRVVVRVATALLFVYTAVNLGAKLVHPPLFAGDMKYSQMREGMAYIASHKQPADGVNLMWNTRRFYDYYDYRLHLNWNITVGTDPREGAASEADITAAAARQIATETQAHGRVWFLLQDELSFLRYRDAAGIVHDTDTPAGIVYEKILAEQYGKQVIEKYNGHAAAAYLVARNAAP